jgi:uncharacterized delta-60 repeat protein
VPWRPWVAAGIGYFIFAVASALAGFIPAGTIDNNFGDEGITDTTFGGSQSDDRANDLVALPPHGRLIVVGEGVVDDSNTEDDFALAGYEPEGHRDTNFGNGGLQTTDFRGGDDQAQAIALAPEGRFVVAGTADAGPSSARELVAVARYKPNGRLDRTFGDDGMVTTRMPNSELDQGHDVVVAGNGEITVAGESRPNSGGIRFALVRYKTDGSLDDGFSGDGRVTTAFPGRDGFDEATAIAAAGRKVVAAGESDLGSFPDFALARYRRDGSLDPGFGGDGRVTTDVLGGSDQAQDVLVQPNGRIVTAGDSQSGSQADYSITRHLDNGQPDNTFSGDGLETESFSSTSQERINGLALQGNDKILAAGSGDGDFAVMRFLSGGGLDTTFSPDAPTGIVFTDFANRGETAQAIVIQPGDHTSPKRVSRRGTGETARAVVAGYTDQFNIGDHFDFALARYYAQG